MVLVCDLRQTARVRIRHLSAGVVFAALAVVALAGHVRGAAPGLVSCPPNVRGLGQIVFVAQGRVELVDLDTCTLTELATGAFGEVRFSADRRWVGYSRTSAGVPGRPMVVSVRGGVARAPLGSGILAWSWASKGNTLYGVN